MATFHGTGIQFGVSSSISSVTGALQTRDHDVKTDIEEIRNSMGEVISTVHYNQVEEGSFEYVVTGGTTNGTASMSVPTIGSMVTVTDSLYSQIAGTTWIVIDYSSKGSNTSALKVTLKLRKYTNVTS